MITSLSVNIVIFSYEGTPSEIIMSPIKRRAWGHVTEEGINLRGIQSMGYHSNNTNNLATCINCVQRSVNKVIPGPLSLKMTTNVHG